MGGKLELTQSVVRLSANTLNRVVQDGTLCSISVGLAHPIAELAATGESSVYPMMIVGIYATLGVFLIPENRVSTQFFALVSNQR